MARVLEARRVLVQESGDRRTLSPPRGGFSCAGVSSGGGSGLHGGSPGQQHQQGRRRALHALDSQHQQHAESPSEAASMTCSASSSGRPDSPTSIAARFSDIFGKDVQEEEVEERKIVYSMHDQYGRKEYIGPIINGKRHGAGVLIYHNNDRCEALFENGALVEPTRFVRSEQEGGGGGGRRGHAKGNPAGSGNGNNKKAKMTSILYNDDPDGCIHYIGPVSNGNKRHGYGSLYCRRVGESMKLEGTFENDEMSFGKVMWEDGSVYTGEVHNFLPNGTGRKAYADGSVYFGHWWNGMRDGHGRLSYPNADVLECEFNYDKPCGQGTLTWGSGRSLTGIFTETGLPQDCTMTATAIWWVSFFGSLTFFLYFNIWAADPCSWSEVMKAGGSRVSWRCTTLSEKYSLALRLNHWFHIYDHFPSHNTDLTGRLTYLASTGLLASLDLLVWLALLVDSVTFIANGLFHNDPFSELHKRIAYAIFKPAVWLYTHAPHLLERFGNDEDQWTAVLLVSQVLVGCTILTLVCVANILPHVQSLAY